jgi:hypothetical protein
MAGGLFGTPLYLNPKCIVFAALLVIVWRLVPRGTRFDPYIALFLGTLAYVSMAWYDYIYDCADRLGPSPIAWISSPLKSPDYQRNFQLLPVRYKKIVRNIDIAVLVALIAGFVWLVV